MRTAPRRPVRSTTSSATPRRFSAFERTRREAEIQALEATVGAIAGVDGERPQAGVLASTVLEAGRLATGRAAIVRPAEGTVIVGDLPGGALAELARDRRLPAVVGTNEAPLAAQTMGADTTVALVTISDGRVLAAVGPAEVLTARLPLLERVARAARDGLDIVSERDAMQLAANELGHDVETLGGALRAKEDALATAVHELRNPLTAVHGYATLMSRNLQAVQGQLTQLERLMADLLSAEQRTEGGEAPVDAVGSAREAIARARIRGARIDLDAPAGPVRVAIGEARFAQILDNLISNAMKYSRPAAPTVVTIAVEGGHGMVSVADQGIGIPPADRGRVFDRFYRVGAAGA